MSTRVLGKHNLSEVQRTKCHCEVNRPLEKQIMRASSHSPSDTRAPLPNVKFGN